MRQLILLALLVFFSSCEEEKETEMVCSEMENLEGMPVVTNKFDNEPSRANCDAIVNLTQEMYDCMSNGPKKDRMKDNLENMKSACNSKLIFFNQKFLISELKLFN